MDSNQLNNMLSGRLYDARDPELAARRLRARRLTARYNGADPEDDELRRETARELLGSVGEGWWISIGSGSSLESSG